MVAPIRELERPSSLRADDAEKSVLGAMMRAPSQVSTVELTAGDFDSPQHRAIFGAIVATYADIGDCDPLSVENHLPSGAGVTRDNLLDLLEVVISAASLDYHVELVRQASRRRRIAALGREMASRAEAEDPDELLIYLRERADKLAEGGSGHVASAIQEAAKRLVEGSLSHCPPRREYLLRWKHTDGKPAAPGCGDGFASMGVPGLLASAGGVGKTHLMLSLGASIIIGRDWLGFEIDRKRIGQRVCLVLAEETPEEAHRRLFDIAEAWDLSESDRRAIEDRLTVLALAGRPVALASFSGETSCPSAEFVALLDMLENEAEPWALVVLDPVARLFPGAESDNVLATFAVQLMEQVCRVPGHPFVLAPTHSSKFARRSNSVDSRGVTGLDDGVRWSATLKAISRTRVELDRPKASYCAPMEEPLLLGRGRGGVLRVLSAAELEGDEAAAASAEDGQLMEDVEKVVDALRGNRSKSKADVGRLAGIRAQRAGPAVDRAMSLGLIVKAGPTRDLWYRNTEDWEREEQARSSSEGGSKCARTTPPIPPRNAGTPFPPPGEAENVAHVPRGSGVPGKFPERGNAKPFHPEDGGLPAQPGARRSRPH